jgi:hypothetical protein
MAHDAPSSFYSSVRVQSLSQILESLRSGEVLIPSFHRPLVWPKEMRLALFDSVLRGIPIGAIMVWRTTSTMVRVRESVGPFRLANRSDAKVHQYLLDGQQRLMTLFLALFSVERLLPSEGGSGLEFGEDEAADSFETFFDLVGQRFVVRSELKTVLATHLPLVDVLAARRLRRFERNLEESTRREMDLATVDVLTDRADKVAEAFRRYELPVIEMASDDLDAVAMTFQRINSQQVAVSEAQMINALVHPMGGLDFLDRVDAIRNESLSKLGWSTLDEQTILRACKIELHLPVYEAQAEGLSRRFAEDPSVLDRVAEHLVKTAAFFNEEAHMRAPEIVPHQIQIVLVAAAFRYRPDMPKDARLRLAAWVRVTTYAGILARPVSERQFWQLHEDVRNVVANEPVSADFGQLGRKALERFDFRNGRARLLAVWLAERDPLDPAEGNEWRRPLEQLARRGVGVVPQVVRLPAVNGAVSASPGTRVVLPRESVQALQAALRNPSAYAGDIDALCHSHLISPAARSAFACGEHARFVQLREEEINHFEEEDFRACLDMLMRRHT